MVAVAAKTPQIAALALRVDVPIGVKAAQLVMLAAYVPPRTKIGRASQTSMLLLRSAGETNVEAFTSQAAVLIAYQTGVPDPARSRAWTFTLDGHTFYVLDLGQEGTFLYDTVTSQWCKFSTDGYGQWNFRNGCQWGNLVVGADLLTDEIWQQVPTQFLDEGWRDITHAVTGGVTTRSRTYISCDALRLAASIGLLDTLNGATMTLRFSDDQEATWSPPYTIDLIQDDFDGELAWRSLGSFMAPGRIFEITDIGGLIRIDGADAFLNGFDNDQQSQE
jgi:hypothetical protein